MKKASIIVWFGMLLSFFVFALMSHVVHAAATKEKQAPPEVIAKVEFPMPVVRYEPITDRNGQPDPLGRNRMVIDFHKGQKLTHKGDTIGQLKDAEKFGTELGEALYSEFWGKIEGHSIIIFGEYQAIIRKWRLFPWEPIEAQALKICRDVLTVHYQKLGEKPKK
jgi:hypothetical protein